MLKIAPHSVIVSAGDCLYNQDIVIKRLKKWLGMSHWLPHWRGELESALQENQSNTRIQMAVVVAKDSDSYSELLFLLTLLGLGIGSAASFYARELFESPIDLLAMPLLGFSSGVLVYQFRALYVHKLAPKAVRERVSNKAKAFYFDYLSSTESPLFLLYISEIENEAYFVSIPQMLRHLGEAEPQVQSALHRLIVNYDTSDPIPAIKIAMREITEILAQHLGIEVPDVVPSPKSLVFMPTDSRTSFPSVMLKGNKDIN